MGTTWRLPKGQEMEIFSLHCIFKKEEGAINSVQHGINCLGYNLEAKLTEEYSPLWVTTSGLPMDDKYQQILNGFFSRFGTIVKDTRKKLWRGTSIWNTEWETLIFLKEELPTHIDIGANRAYLRWKGMIKIGFKCQSTAHIAKDCDADKKAEKETENSRDENGSDSEQAEKVESSKSWHDQVEEVENRSSDILVLERTTAGTFAEAAPEVLETSCPPVGELATPASMFSSHSTPKSISLAVPMAQRTRQSSEQKDLVKPDNPSVGLEEQLSSESEDMVPVKQREVTAPLTEPTLEDATALMIDYHDSVPDLTEPVSQANQDNGYQKVQYKRRASRSPVAETGNNIPVSKPSKQSNRQSLPRLSHTSMSPIPTYTRHTSLTQPAIKVPKPQAAGRGIKVPSSVKTARKDNKP